MPVLRTQIFCQEEQRAARGGVTRLWAFEASYGRADMEPGPAAPVLQGPAVHHCFSAHRSVCGSNPASIAGFTI
jgi:hypothetical protein